MAQHHPFGAATGAGSVDKAADRVAVEAGGRRVDIEIIAATGLGDRRPREHPRPFRRPVDRRVEADHQRAARAPRRDTCAASAALETITALASACSKI